MLPPPPSDFSLAISQYVARQQHNYVHDPVRAHADSAAVAVVAGTGLGSVRGALSAFLSPPAGRLQVMHIFTKLYQLLVLLNGALDAPSSPNPLTLAPASPLNLHNGQIFVRTTKAASFIYGTIAASANLPTPPHTAAAASTTSTNAAAEPHHDPTTTHSPHVHRPVVPFLLGSQFDVWCACADRRNADARKERSRWGLAGDLGGAADMS